MPRKRKQQEAAAPTMTSAPDANVALVAKLCRVELEQLVLESLRSGLPVHVERLTSARPSATLMQDVAASETMEGAGAFSWLPIDVIVLILQRLTLPKRLTFSIEICKGLRPLRQAVLLWTHLATSTLSIDSSYHSTTYEDIHWINGRGLLRLADWLPNCSCVSVLRLHLRGAPGQFTVDESAAFLARFPDVEKLSLTGNAVNKKLLVAIDSVDRPKLRHLALEWGTVGASTVLSILKRAPNLTSITSPNLNTEVLRGFAMLLHGSRGGGTPLLTSLRQVGMYNDKLTVFDGCGACRLFPELTDLVVSFQLVGPAPQLPSQPLAGANLRRLHIFRMIRSFDSSPDVHLSTGCLSALVHLLVSKNPRLEALSLTHGKKVIGRNESLPPLPKLGRALANVALPRSLIMLHLQDIIVCPEDVAMVELPELAFVRLVHCGPDAHAAIDTLISLCPKLKTCICKDKIPDGLEHCGGSRVNFFGFPRSELTGLSATGLLKAIENGYDVRGL
jgi:hypothetical protein